MAFQNGVSSSPIKAMLHVPTIETNRNEPIEIISFSPIQNGTQNGVQDGDSFSPVFPGCYVDIAPFYPEQGHVYKVEKVIFKGKSQYQDLFVFQVVILDGSLQLTEKDEFAYQEMLTHLPLCSILNPKKVLLIGGGDGGILREVSRHACVEQIDICDLDKMVIDVYKKHFPDIAIGYKDPRVNSYIGDGVAFIKSVPPATYDAIIIDAFQGMGAYATELSNEDILKSIAKALKPGGVMSAPADSIWLNNFAMEDTITLCLDFKRPVNPLDPSNFGVAKGPPKFYNSEIHTAAFSLPAFAKSAMGSKYA
ncbi:spermidine synthase 1-like [Cucumis melo var. makuwa]|uniref:Spermidine synthase 1-like n=1 Tax=Cucumis melo var. makuwa TaxID=1194695 RepID=A0A5A7UJN5_CUCMM|nr:spermidine synthase 1-like [Cucumis melo var. makuwa]